MTNNVNALAQMTAGKDVASAKKVYDAAVGRYWEMSAAKHEVGSVDCSSCL